MKLRSVPAATGLQWVKLGIRTFLRQPLAMSGLFFLFMVAISLLALLPVIGTALSALLTPAANLGLMAASKDASEGRFPMPSTLVTAFRSGQAKTRGMMVLGGLYGFALLLVLGLATLVDNSAPVPADAAMTAEAMVQATLASPSLWVTMAVMVPLQMLFWHAPALLHWHDVPPVKSLFFSAMACWANKGALLVFMLGWMGVFMVLGLVISVVGALLGGAQVLTVILYPVVLFMASMFFTSIYFTFRDSFYSATDPDGTPPPTDEGASP
jgi:hypothetical protein